MSAERIEAALRELAAALREEIEGEHHPADGLERLLSVPEAAAALGIGRTLVYSEIGAGRLRSVKVGRRRLVAESAIAGYVRDRA